jgi:ABC-type branched-subunit amino acid transport system permease subunit
LPRNAALALAVVGGGLLLAAPHLAATKVPLFTTAAAFVFIFASLHLLVRTSGQVSLCHMALAAVGAAVFARCSQAGIPFGASLLLAGLAAVPVGAVIAVPAIRLSGLYLAIATFGFGILVQNLAFPSFLLFGPRLTQVANRPRFASGDDTYYYLVLGLAVLACLAVVVVRRSRLGRCLRALADSPAAVAAQGANGNVMRVLVFCISAFLAGVGGGLIGPITGSASGVTFSFSVSLVLIAVLYIAGRRPVVSAFIAAGAYIVAPSYSHSENAGIWTQIVFGVAALVVACDVPVLLRDRWFGSARAAERVDVGSGVASAARERVIAGARA